MKLKQIMKRTFIGYSVKSSLIRDLGYITVGLGWFQIALNQYWYNWVVFISAMIIGRILVEEVNKITK